MLLFQAIYWILGFIYTATNNFASCFSLWSNKLMVWHNLGTYEVTWRHPSPAEFRHLRFKYHHGVRTIKCGNVTATVSFKSFHKSYRLYSDTSFKRSSVEILLLSCLYNGENLESLSTFPWLSLNTDLKENNSYSGWYQSLFIELCF